MTAPAEAKKPVADQRILLRGSIALARGALDAGCSCYFGYPITPQNEIPEYLAVELPRRGGVFIQAESEIASINMVLGAAAAGVRVMTSSSSPGISLMQEALSYMAGMELPAVVVNIMRTGPGLGGISPSQADYFQATKGGGHGDYRLVVLAPASVQEMYDLTLTAFSLAERFRNPAMILADAVLGQMKEPVAFIEKEAATPKGREEPPWALTGARGRKPRIIKSLHLDEEEMAAHNWQMREKYAALEAEETLVEMQVPGDAQALIVAYGICARVAQTALSRGRQEGLSLGLIRPITLFPFPFRSLYQATQKVPRVLVVEMSTGQMVEDVRLAAAPGTRVELFGKPGGAVPSPSEILFHVRKLVGRR